VDLPFERDEREGENSLVPMARQALLAVDVEVFGAMARAYDEGLALLKKARESLVEALADDRMEEHELLEARHIVLQLLAALRPFSPHNGMMAERLLKLMDALVCVSDCFIPHALAANSGPGAQKGIPTDLGEFSLEIFESRLGVVLEICGQSFGVEAGRDKASFSEQAPLAYSVPSDSLFGPSLGYLDLIERVAIPGVMYGSTSRRENPYFAARAMRAGAEHLRVVLLERCRLTEPIQRLSRLEGQLTSVIEQVRESGAPIQGPDGLLKRFQANRLDAFRDMCQELTEIERMLSEQSPAKVAEPPFVNSSGSV